MYSRKTSEDPGFVGTVLVNYLCYAVFNHSCANATGGHALVLARFEKGYCSYKQQATTQQE
jgi:hypothetical protein